MRADLPDISMAGFGSEIVRTGIKANFGDDSLPYETVGFRGFSETSEVCASTS
jgi:hypothetical protein